MIRESTRTRTRAAILQALREGGGSVRWSMVALVARPSTEETVKAIRDELEAEGVLTTRRGGPRGQMMVDLVRDPDVDRVTPESPHWTPFDLDRCEHGRHSIDPCADCPGGQSGGNRFLSTSHDHWVVDDGGTAWRRIGTSYDRQPILVNPSRYGATT